MDEVIPDAGALREALEEAAGEVRARFRLGVAATRKTDGSPLTEADLRANEVLLERLGPLLPGAGWLSEETRDDPARLERRWAWVVDPLDGTKEFVAGVPEFAVSVGLVQDGEPVLGAVVNPASGEGGIARAGAVRFWGFGKARLPPARLQDAEAIVSRSEVEDGSARPWLGFVGATRPVGSVAYKLLRVAAGADDLTFSVQPKSEWDVCGGVALLRAAGKTYRRLDGAPLQFNQPVPRLPAGSAAGSEPLVEALLARAARAQPRTHL